MKQIDLGFTGSRSLGGQGLGVRASGKTLGVVSLALPVPRNDRLAGR